MVASIIHTNIVTIGRWEMKKKTLVVGMCGIFLAAGCRTGAEPLPVEPTPISVETVQEEATPTTAPSETPSSEPEPMVEKTGSTMKIESNAFEQGDPIPAEFTCEGDDLSPALSWSDAPEKTVKYVLIMDDPDAPVGTWDHWLLYNIPGETSELAPAISAEAELPDGSRHGNNSWDRLGYGGPCPPSGTHRYFFKLYAIDTVLDLEPGATKDELLAAIEGRILAEAELMGTFSR
jgi:Raf kinase inhibitor-like YbhB/YbcL family protein